MHGQPDQLRLRYWNRTVDSLFASTPIPLLEQVVTFTQARHQVLAGNVANLDTPGYRTRDLSPALFHQRLKEALRQDRMPLAAASSHGPDRPGTHAISRAGESLTSILRHDDSNVGLERQVTELAKNLSQHNLALTILNNQYRLLQAAITERA